jgi:D-alanyl-D-alanine carboxypeptidase
MKRTIAAWAIAILAVVAAAALMISAFLSTPSNSALPSGPHDATAPGSGSTSQSTSNSKSNPKSGSPSNLTSSGSLTVVVNKQRPLSPRNYVPVGLVDVNVPFVGVQPQLRAPAATGVESLFAAFEQETGLQMQSNSAYRSYADQQVEYRTFANRLGSAGAAETTARPGYSEHQTGLAIDIGAKGSSCTSRDCFAATAQARWLSANAWRFGFIIRYPAGQQAVTGYSYEPWHIRFVGTGLAKKIHGHFGSLEAYFGLPPAPHY